MTRKPRRQMTQSRKHKMSPKEVKAGAAAMSAAMMKKAPGSSKAKKRKY